MPGTTSTAPGAPNAGASTGAPHPRRWIALAVIAVAQLMVVLDATIVNIALPQAQADLGITDANRQWVITAYTLAFGGLLLLGGRIADYWGRKRTFLVGMTGFALASALGGAGAPPVRCSSPPARCRVPSARCSPRPRWRCSPCCSPRPRSGPRRSLCTARSPAVASAVGLLLGGVLTEYADWRWCLLVNIPVAADRHRVRAAAGAGEPGPRQHPLRRARRDRW